jgi:N-acyl-L-homoserine lactone synthetase
MDAETRRRLADALREATPEMLRGDAEWARLSGISCIGTVCDDGKEGRYFRLAALALAAAEIQELDAEIDTRKDGRVYLWLGPVLTMHDNVPAALAALIVEGA